MLKPQIRSTQTWTARSAQKQAARATAPATPQRRFGRRRDEQISLETSQPLWLNERRTAKRERRKRSREQKRREAPNVRRRHWRRAAFYVLELRLLRAKCGDISSSKRLVRRPMKAARGQTLSCPQEESRSRQYPAVLSTTLRSGCPASKRLRFSANSARSGVQ